MASVPFVTQNSPLRHLLSAGSARPGAGLPGRGAGGPSLPVPLLLCLLQGRPAPGCWPSRCSPCPSAGSALYLPAVHNKEQVPPQVSGAFFGAGSPSGCRERHGGVVVFFSGEFCLVWECQSRCQVAARHAGCRGPRWHGHVQPRGELGSVTALRSPGAAVRPPHGLGEQLVQGDLAPGAGGVGGMCVYSCASVKQD